MIISSWHIHSPVPVLVVGVELAVEVRVLHSFVNRSPVPTIARQP